MALAKMIEDVVSSLSIATLNCQALDAGISELSDAVAEHRFGDVEAIREKLLAAVDGYVDNYVAAARRVAHEASA